MANTIDIRRRIRSVKNTQQITKAMKMVSAAKLRRAQDRMFAARPSAAALREARPERHGLLLVVTSDKGLCGAFNSNVIRASQNALRERNWESVELLPIGRKALDFYKRRPFPIRREATHVFQALSLGTAHDIAQTMIDEFVSEKVDAVYVVYNEFKSIIAQTIRVERLLPIERAWG